MRPSVTSIYVTHLAEEYGITYDQLVCKRRFPWLVAIRAYKDRPSMEKELQELREGNDTLRTQLFAAQKAALKARISEERMRGRLKECAEHTTRQMTAEIRAELQALQEQVDRLASDNARLSRTEELDLIKLRELNGRNQVLTDKLRGDMVWIEDLRAKCERLEAGLVVMGGLVRAAIDGNAATRQDVILQIGRMISQALNEKGEE